MKMIFATDLHGSRWKYEKLVGVAKRHRAKIVINGGDMLPKGGNLFEQDKFITRDLENHFAQFDSAGIYYLCYLGNDDLRIFDQLFEETCRKHPFVTCLAQRKFEMGGYEFIGMNWVVDYPFQLKDRCRMDSDGHVFQRQLGTGLLSRPGGWEEIDDWFAHAKTLPTIEEELKALPQPKDIAKSVYVIHMPPSGLGLDKCSGGDEVGSKAIYNFIKSHQPLLTLHGHIHESPALTGKWSSKLGQTTCIQPGQLDAFTYVTIDVPRMKCERINLEKTFSLREFL